MSTVVELTQTSGPSTRLPIRPAHHRQLTPSEVRTIWQLLNPSSLPGATQEIHITLTQHTELPCDGWMIQLGQA
ncbi:MAG: hypothetical protein FJ147_17150 [Deltaproteobacteria bacterium]|nr:hypothetical protein [Deltaproteobacteria bacterium]